MILYYIKRNRFRVIIITCEQFINIDTKRKKNIIVIYEHD